MDWAFMIYHLNVVFSTLISTVYAALRSVEKTAKAKMYILAGIKRAAPYKMYVERQ